MVAADLFLKKELGVQGSAAGLELWLWQNCSSRKNLVCRRSAAAPPPFLAQLLLLTDEDFKELEVPMGPWWQIQAALAKQ